MLASLVTAGEVIVGAVSFALTHLQLAATRRLSARFANAGHRFRADLLGERCLREASDCSVMMARSLPD